MKPVRGRVRYGRRGETIEAKQDWFLTLSASQRFDLSLAWPRLLPEGRLRKKRVRYARPIR